ncbi:MAG: hypothetical protein HQ507_07460 [Candidatus Marinimicrobia bacterium]|nr:hypothetical protein [Candidatus Neomarinimicrobiota bacterium]
MTTTIEQKRTLKWLISLLLSLALSQGIMGADKIRRGSLEWFVNGPEKTWTQTDFRLYNEWRENKLSKAVAEDEQLLRRQKAIMNGNKITTEIWNYGSISRPGNTITDIVWEGLGYGYEFGPFICAEVDVQSDSHEDAYIAVDAEGDTLVYENGDPIWRAQVISDGLTSNGGETSPDGQDFWGWSPLAFDDAGIIPFADPLTDRMPISNDLDRDGDGKPDSWPAGWYSESLEKYVWPGALKQGSANSDMEIYFVVDDRMNREFAYYPFSDDSSKQGLGIAIECRYYQWSNPLAEDIIFLVYKVTNKSEKDLEDVIFGMWGDPHIGGPSNYNDDLSFFDHELNMVYAWDEDGRSDKVGSVPGYFGYKFLESPGNPYDGLDNDQDGMIDESWTNGIDDDGDWNPEKDDVGLDGVANTGDEGESDGVPTAGDPYDPRQPGEPNYEFTDIDESDMIGLTSFASPQFGSPNYIRNDDYIINEYLQPGYYDSSGAALAGDNIFLYGSGKFPLPRDESRRFSIGLIIGQDFDDLTLNAETANQIYQSNYQFATPPPKPNVIAVAGDQKVTLYWDDIAEDAYDPISESNDFEGYVIYRSTDPSFLDQQTITDSYGSKFLFEPLKMGNGAEARFDLDNEYVGLSSVPYANRGSSYYLGNNTGIRHAFVDSNQVMNGQTYYYAVVSYDHGVIELEIAPTECSKNITLNPESNEIFLDANTVRVVPTAPAAGYIPGIVNDGSILHTSGVATGQLAINVLDADRVQESNAFEINFQENPTRFSIHDIKPNELPVTLIGSQWFQMPYQNIYDSTFTLVNISTNAEYDRDIDFIFYPDIGQLQRIETGHILSGEPLMAIFTYFPVWESSFIAGGPLNPIFDGMTITVADQELGIIEAISEWSSGSQTTWEASIAPFTGDLTKRFPADYEIRFFNQNVDTAKFYPVAAPFEVWDVTPGQIPEKRVFEVLEPIATKDSLWQRSEPIIIYKSNDGNFDFGWEVTFSLPSTGDTVSAGSGDIYAFFTSRPFTEEDVYGFSTSASHINNEAAKAALDDICVVPNPYVAVSAFEPYDYQHLLDRGDRLVYFDNLPTECTIRIYTIAGEHVKTIEHSSFMSDAQEFWNLTSKDNFPISYGIYLYHVDAGDLGQKIGRIAVIK